MQIAESVGGRRRIVRHVGSARDEAELGLLMDQARQLLVDDGQGVLDLGITPAARKTTMISAPAAAALFPASGERPARAPRVPAARVLKTSSGLLHEALTGVYDSLGLSVVGDEPPRGSPNSRNGSTPKTMQSQVGSLPLQVPRDRAGSFTPQLVPKGARRLGGLDDMIISLYAGGMTVRDIQHHLARTVGTELSHDTISKITDAVLEEVSAWQARPLEPIYPIVYVDALVVKVRDGHQVRNRSAHIAVGVDLDGVKQVLGIWVQATECAKFWAGVVAELANRGVQDILIACCDGLTGLPEAIEATFPHATVQTCVVHLIRASMRFVSYGDRKKVAAALKAVYTAPTVDAAETALLEFVESDLGRKYPTAVGTWQNAWERFVPFLAFGPALRKIIYTTNTIESLNYQLRKIIKNRGHFPNDAAVIKLLWLAIRVIEDKRARERVKDRGKPANQRTAPGKLVEGAVTQGWKPAMAEMMIAFGDRIEPHIL